MEYVLHIAIMISVYVILAISLDLLVGHTGLLSVAHGAFFGVGAYTAALLSTRGTSLFPLDVLAALTASALLSLVVSVASLQLRGERFVLLTLAFQLLLVKVATNWIGLTGGPGGIYRIPAPSLMGWTIDTPLKFTLLASSLVVLSYFAVSRIVHSPYGRVLRAIREDEEYTAALGKNPRRFKFEIVMVSSVLAALAGVIYAHYMTYIAPNDFDLGVSLLVIAMVIIGGAGSLWGPIVGATALVLLPELLRFVGLAGPLAANIRQIVYGGLLLVLMLLRPRGLLGRDGFGR